MSLEPGRAIGGYEVVGLVGSGGMGAVYKAYQRSLARYVAIKIISSRAADEPGFKERFVTEGLAIARLRHPNIVTAFDFADDGGVAYLVSEFVDGGTLADQLGSALPLDYVMHMLGPLAGALDYAHSRGVLHRDVKPTNVLIQRDGTPVLTDFGLARILGPATGASQTNAPLGTLEYMSPESASGSAIGPEADQYALAVIAYEMLTGKPPFGGETPIAVLLAQISKTPPSASERGVTLAPAVEEALQRALAKDPDARYASVSEFIRALGSPMSRSAADAVAARPRETARETVAVPAAPITRERPARRGRVIAPAVIAFLALSVALSPRDSTTGPASVQTGDLATLSSISPPLSLDRGAQGECLVAYYNAGANAWVKGTSSETSLVLDDGVPPELRGWAVASAEGAVAEQRSDTIAPGQTAIFDVIILVPAESTARQAELIAHPVQAAVQIGPNASCLVSVR
jgi:serine/threonine protein kinase